MPSQVRILHLPPARFGPLTWGFASGEQFWWLWARSTASHRLRLFVEGRAECLQKLGPATRSVRTAVAGCTRLAPDVKAAIGPARQSSLSRTRAVSASRDGCPQPMQKG